MRDDTGIVGVVESQLQQTLAIHARRVREGKELMPALDFARYVLRSGLITLLNEFGRDGATMRWRVEQLMSEVQDRFTKNDTSPQLKDEDFRTLHDKLDLIAGYVSRIPASPAAQPVPAFSIIQGGASNQTQSSSEGAACG